MLKIVHFIHGLNMGGAETLVKNYALLLDKTKFDVTVFCINHDESPYEKLLKDAGVKIIIVRDYLKWGYKKSLFFRIINHFLLFREISEQFKMISPDIIHVHLSLNKYIKYARFPKSIKIFYTHHYSVEGWKKNHPKDIKALDWVIHHYKTQLIALNRDMQQELDELFAITNTVIINNGIYLNLYKRRIDKKKKREELNIPKDAFLLINVGRFAAIKNHVFLIDIFKEIKKQKPNAFLIMVGRGSTENEIVEKLNNLGLSQSAMILHDRTDVPELLMSADAAIFPSINEGLGIAVIEMQAAGLSCVVSTGVPEATKISNKIRYLSISESPKKWADELLALAADKKKIEYYNLKDWDIRENVKELEKLYERAMLDDGDE